MREKTLCGRRDSPPQHHLSLPRIANTMTGPRTVRVLRDGHPAGSLEVGQDRLVIRLPDPRLLRLVARSVLLAAAVLSFPCLRTVLHDAGLASTYGAAYGFTGSIQEDDAAYMLMLFGDMKRHGLLKAEDRAVFVGDPGSGMPFLKRRRIDPISEQSMWTFSDHTVDFVFVANGSADPYFGFTDRVLKVGGIAAVRLGGLQFRMPPNYRIVYIRRFGSTFVAMKKIAHANANANASPSASASASAADSVGTRMGRRLLAIPEAKKEAMHKLERAISELPALRRHGKYWERARILPDLIMGLLDVYLRGLFSHTPSPGTAKMEDWFKRYNLKKNQEFEIIRVAVSEKGGAKIGGITEWFVRNVKGGRHVVMKAKAELVKEMVRERAIVLVDELLLECSQRLENGAKSVVRRSKKVYWECLALYGKHKDEGVAVRPW